MEISAFSEFFIIQLSVVFLFRSCRSEQTSKKRNECCTNEGNTTASHELCYTKFVGNIRVYQVAKILATLVRRSFIELS